MPNHVYTAMVLNGTPEDLDALWTRLNPQPSKEDPDILTCDLFHSLKPMPEEYNGTTADFGRTKYPELLEKYGANDWYDWCVKNWGTKWGDYNTEIYRRDDHIFLTFTTAWSCPVQFYREHLDNFKFRANEEGIESLTYGDCCKVHYPAEPRAFLRRWAKKNGVPYSYLEPCKKRIDYHALAYDWTMAVETE